MVGLIAKPQHITTQSFRSAGNALLLIGLPGDELGASHYLKIIHGRKEGAPPLLDYDREIAVQQAVLALIRMGLVCSAHDCSEGGLAVALAESAMSGTAPIGADVDLGTQGLRADQVLFNESQSRIILSIQTANLSAALSYLQENQVPARQIGHTISAPVLRITAEKKSWEWPLAMLRTAWADSIERIMAE